MSDTYYDEITIVCKCGNEINLNDKNIAEWHDDDEYKDGTHLWNVHYRCPKCRRSDWIDIVL